MCCIYIIGNQLVLEGYPGLPEQRIWLSNVACEGNENSLFDCTHDPIGTSVCTHKQDVVVFCNMSGKLNLVGTNTRIPMPPNS